MNNDRFKFRFYEKRPTEFYIRYEFNDDYIINDGQVYEKFYDENGVTLELCENIIACQCTGLKDKNGVLIYEGDVWQRGQFRSVVVFGYSAWAFEGTKNSKVISYPSFYSNADSGEVIGNIYENKELLE